MALQVCSRCRKRKIRCDLQLPSCKNCQLADVECLFWDDSVGREISCSYLHSLNQKVASLQLEISNATTTATTHTSIPSSDNSAEAAPSPWYQSYHLAIFDHGNDYLDSSRTAYLGPGSAAALLEGLLKFMIQWHVSNGAELPRRLLSRGDLVQSIGGVDLQSTLSPFQLNISNEQRRLELHAMMPPSTQRAVIEHYLTTVSPQYTLFTLTQESRLLSYDNALKWISGNKDEPGALALRIVFAISTSLIARDLDSNMTSTSIRCRQDADKIPQAIASSTKDPVETERWTCTALCASALCELINPLSSQVWDLLGRATSALNRLRELYTIGNKNLDEDFRRLERAVLKLEISTALHLRRASYYNELQIQAIYDNVSIPDESFDELRTLQKMQRIAHHFQLSPRPSEELFERLIPLHMQIGSVETGMSIHSAMLYLSLHPLFTSFEDLSRSVLVGSSLPPPSPLFHIIAHSAYAVLDHFSLLNQQNRIISIAMAAERILESGLVWSIYLIVQRMSTAKTRGLTVENMETRTAMEPILKVSSLLASFTGRWKAASIYVEAWEILVDLLWKMCDLQYPTCGACSIAGATCLGYDAIHGVDKPRSTIVHLENEVARLEAELSRVKTQTRTASDIANVAVENLATRLAVTIVDPSGLSRKQDKDMLPLTSPFFLSCSPSPYLLSDAEDDMAEYQSQEDSSRPINAASVPKHVVDAMLKHYCEIYRPQYPGIEETDLLEACDRVYNNIQPSDADVFYVHITLAISTNTLMHQNEARAMTTTRGFWKTAVAHLPQVGLSDPWERLQVLQLLTHYGFLNPMDVDCCRCAEAATRLCLSLGLHHELPASIQTRLNSRTLNIRRRLFWNSYSIDSASHAARCRPFVLPSSAITAKFPEFHSESSPTHYMWLMRQIESEITVTLYWPSFRFEEPISDASFDQWSANMHKRLDEWRHAILQSLKLTETIEFYELHYHIGILRLNRPSPRCSNPTNVMHKKALTSSVALIRQFSMIDRMGRLFNLWHAAHFIIESGVCLLASVLAGIEQTQRDQTHLIGEDIAILSRYIKAFPSLVSRISRRWPTIAKHIPTLQEICFALLNNLQQWATGTTIDMSALLALKQRIISLPLFPAFSSNPQPIIENHLVSQPVSHGEEESATRSSFHPHGINPLGSDNPRTTTGETLSARANFTSAFLYDPFSYNSDTQISMPSNIIAPLNSAWIDPQLESTTALSDIQGLQTYDALTWDFAGMNSEQIIAELLDVENNPLLSNYIGSVDDA